MNDPGRRHAAGARGDARQRGIARLSQQTQRRRVASDEAALDADALGEAALPVRDERRPTAIDPRRKAMELLTRREHSRQELERKLIARGFDDEAVRDAVEDMAARGWQDDTRFAHALARTRLVSGHGPVRIRAELHWTLAKSTGMPSPETFCSVVLARASPRPARKRHAAVPFCSAAGSTLTPSGTRWRRRRGCEWNTLSVRPPMAGRKVSTQVLDCSGGASRSRACNCEICRAQIFHLD